MLKIIWVFGIFFVCTWAVHITKLATEVTVVDTELLPNEHLNLKGTKKLSKSNIEHIILKNCSGVIDGTSLKHFPKLHKLTIWRSDIRSISTIFPINNLISVGSRLPNLDEQLQRKLPKLQTLFLIGNKDFEVDPYVFRKFKSLVALYISEANFTETCITKEWFKDMGQLEELSLSDNNLDCISEDAFNNLKVLRKLDLTYNKFTTLDKKVFKKLTKLENLGIYNNNIEDFDINFLDSQRKHLEGLGISWSMLSNLDAESFLKLLPKLKWVSFGHEEMPNDFQAGVFCQILRQHSVNCITDSVFGVSKILGYSL
ncbi:uncharacterized protein LOC115874582 [Sitophilus oryzae]|uniref:Uncharacterized protein LOC115874582 n=1 Tax=Sitophilus oryzae TaxID=7048 RepID=A0A6J2X3Q6_SITOR|nr:uncharacterized protein LOC115874582 [Sitophilus oryzae]